MGNLSKLLSNLLNFVFKYASVVLDIIQQVLMMVLKLGRPVKGNIEGDKKVYYLPAHPRYGDVEVSVLKGEKYFLTETAALKDGWVAAE